MTVVKSLRTGESEAEFRQLRAYLYQQVSTGKAATGVLTGCSVGPTTPSASGSVVISPGLAVCQPTTGGGVYEFPVTAADTVDVFTANPMQFVNNPRNDIVGIDQTTGLGAVLPGTAGAIPTDPTIPTTFVPLVRLRHAANATTIPSTVMDDLRQPTGVFGGAVLVASTGQRDALPKYVGLKVYRTDVKREETWDGTGWFTEVFGMDTVVTTNSSGEFSFSTGLSTILYANVYNGNGGLVRAGNRQNVTIARNSAGASYTGGTLTGIIFAADTKAAVSSTSARVDWVAKGYA